MSKKVQGPHEDITYRIIGAAMAVHRRLGPGHKEEVYQEALEAEFAELGLPFEAQKCLEVYDEGRLPYCVSHILYSMYNPSVLHHKIRVIRVRIRVYPIFLANSHLSQCTQF